MKTLLGFIGWILIFLILMQYRCGCASRGTPEVTDCKKETIHSGSLAHDTSYWFVEYRLCDEDRECVPFGRETFLTFKKDNDHIDRNDICEHCKRKWKWHYNR